MKMIGVGGGYRMEKEFEPLQRAALEVFREIYPNREHFLKKR